MVDFSLSFMIFIHNFSWKTIYVPACGLYSIRLTIRYINQMHFSTINLMSGGKFVFDAKKKNPVFSSTRIEPIKYSCSYVRVLFVYICACVRVYCICVLLCRTHCNRPRFYCGTTCEIWRRHFSDDINYVRIAKW